MWTLIRNGGVVPMSFLLLFGLLALGSAFHFALRADRRTRGFATSMARATVYTTLAATFADLGATFMTVARALEQGASPLHAGAMLVEGLGESTSPGILGFAFVALTSMLVAVGRRREGEGVLGAAADRLP